MNTGVLATLDTAVPELWLPHNFCDQLASVLNLTYHEDSGRYTLTDEAHNALQSLDGSLRFRLGTDVHSDPFINLEIPYKAFDLQASWPIFNTTTRYFPLRKTANKTQYALGRVFLQEAYLVVDWERDTFELSQAIFSDPMPEANIVTILPNNNQTSSTLVIQESGPRLSTGEIAGIAIGITLLVLSVAAVSLWFWRRKRRPDTTFQVLQGHGRTAPSELAVQNKAELEGVRPVQPELYAPPKPHELAHGQGENVRVEIFAPPVLYEMGDTSVHRI